MFSHRCNKLVSKSCPSFFFPKCEIKMPLTKTKKIHRELRKNRTDVVFLRCEILEKYLWERSVFALFVYLLIYF